MSRRCSFGLCAILAVAVPAGADPGSDGAAVAAHIFEMSDRDRDGALTRAEFAAAKLERYGLPFEEYDGDSDEVISSAEYMALYRRIHSRRLEHDV